MAEHRTRANSALASPSPAKQRVENEKRGGLQPAPEGLPHGEPRLTQRCSCLDRHVPIVFDLMPFGGPHRARRLDAGATHSHTLTRGRAHGACRTEQAMNLAKADGAMRIV